MTLKGVLKGDCVLHTALPPECPQPIIVQTGDVWTTQDFAIHVEGTCVCQANDVVFAFELLMMCHYIFNIQYAPKANSLLKLFQVAVLGIRDKSAMPKGVLTLINKLTDA